MANQTEAFGRYPSLVDRHILVTGGGSGIGASIVEALVAQGAQVSFIDIDASASAVLCDDLSDARHRPAFRQVDITDIAAFQGAISDLEQQLGPIRGLVNNAANDTRHLTEDVTPEFWRKAFAVNLDHQFFAAQAVAEGMAKAGGGSIVNMGSISWRVGMAGMPAYVSAKSGIEGLTNGLARELGPKKIRVNCLTPGFVRTARQVELWLTPDLEREVFDSQCLQEYIEPQYVANMVTFLLSEDSRMCTSGVFPVHAGWI